MVPSYLSDYAAQYAADPRVAALQWFREARFGLFLHYGLYSLLGRHEWVMLREKIRPAEYARLAEQFTASNFDAESICELAEAAQMKYVNLTTRHHDSFCLFETKATDFQSLNTPCGRDLVAELAAACQRHGLGLCLYYSHGRDWKHPHAPNNDWGGRARPEYDPPEESYAFGAEHDLDRYLEFMTQQVTELLTQYGPVAAIWLDGIAVPASGDKALFKCQELYDHIHSLQPQVLVSYKQGLLGTEDFYAPEHKAVETGGKPGEICTTTHNGWGYVAADDGRHKTADDLWPVLENARSRGFNLLLNSGPLPDGSLHPEDVKSFWALGERIRATGWPGE
jgi:alpha-L-fucosidase